MPPNNFFFEFEIKRLGFTHFGTLKYVLSYLSYPDKNCRNMTENNSKMIIGMFILIRVLIYQFLLCPGKELKHLHFKIPSNDLTKQ